MLIEALFTIVRQHKCPSIDGCERDVACNGILLSHKKDIAICDNMDGPRSIILSQIKTNGNVESQEKKKTLNKTETDLQVQRTSWWSPEVGSGWAK